MFTQYKTSFSFILLISGFLSSYHFLQSKQTEQVSEILSTQFNTTISDDIIPSQHANHTDNDYLIALQQANKKLNTLTLAIDQLKNDIDSLTIAKAINESRNSANFMDQNKVVTGKLIENQIKPQKQSTEDLFFFRTR